MDRDQDAAKRPTSISLGAAGSISQTFDRAGNVTSDGRSLTGITGDAGTGTQAVTYDNDTSRLKTISPPGGGATQITFSLDALDRHASRLVNGSTTDTYAYLDATEM